MTKELQTIIEAYETILAEGKEAKFKVGDKVGIGSTHGGSEYYGHDTGTVTKVNANGYHTVQFDTRKSADDNVSPYTEIFNHQGQSKKQYSGQKIIPLQDHNDELARQKDQRERNADLSSVASHLSGLRNGFGNHSKITKAHSEFMKALIDKHTEEK